MPFSFSRVVTIHHAKCGSGDSANFPVAIFGTYTYLRTVAHGGQVQNANGYDIGFFTNLDGTGKLDWEVESYNATTGAVAYWVRVPVLSASTDVKFYIMYGDATIITDQSNHTAVWDSNYVGVWHFATEGAGPAANVTDSTVFARTDVVHNGSPIAGVVDGAVGAPGLGGYPAWSDTGLPAGASPRTFEFWVQSTGSGPILGYGTDSAGALIFLGTHTSGTHFEIRNSGVGGLTDFVLPTSIAAGLHQIVVTMTGAVATVYEDGAAVAGQIGFAAVLNTVLLGHIALCHPNDGQAYGQIGGTVDELRVSNSVRGPNWILASYNNQFDPITFYTISGADTPFTAQCGSPPIGIVGETFTHTFPAPVDGGTPPFIWGLLHRDHTALVPEDVIDGIPLGLFGLWTGIPTAVGTFPFSLVIVDVNEETSYTDCTLVVVDHVVAQCNNPCDAILGLLYNHAFSTAGGAPPYTWAITAGTLPAGLTLSTAGVVSGIATAIGASPVTMQVTDSNLDTATVNCTLTVIEHVCPWQLCDLFTTSPDCALTGAVGLKRTANGALGSSDAASSTPITVSAGQIYFVEFHLRGSGGADGTISVGFDYYDINNTYLSSAVVTSTGSPVVYTIFTGTVTVPANAVSAVPIVKAVGHLTGVWCISALFSVLLDSNFILSSIRSYFSEFSSYR